MVKTKIKLGILGCGRVCEHYIEKILIPERVGELYDVVACCDVDPKKSKYVSERFSCKAFNDIEELALQCRFSDCNHESEPGCAVQQAIQDGTLDPDRLKRWQKLRSEDAFNSSSLAERREKDRSFGKMVKRVMSDKARYN